MNAVQRKPLFLRSSEGKPLPFRTLSLAFALGSIGGCLLAASLSDNGNTVLFAYIAAFFQAVQGGALEPPGVLAAGWSVLRWPLSVVLLGCTALSSIGIPIILFLRGFLLSFSVSAFVLVLGRSGALFAALLLGVGSLLTIPVLFLLGTDLLAGRGSGARMRGQGLSRQFAEPHAALRRALILGAFGLAVMWEAYILPGLVTGGAQWFVL